VSTNKRLPLISTIAIAVICVGVFLILLPMALLSGDESTEIPYFTPKPVVLSYTNADHDFSMNFPQYWYDMEPSDSIVLLYSPQIQDPDFLDLATTIGVSAHELPSEVIEAGLEDYMRKSEANLEADAPNYTKISLESTTTSGLPAMVLTSSMYAEGDESSLITKQAVFFKQEMVYIITYTSVEDYYEEYLDAFDMVISSFRFHDTEENGDGQPE
jgi:hypothetical protein